MTDGLGEAVGRFNSGRAEQTPMPEEPAQPEADSGHAAIHYHNHEGGKHSVHKISHEGTAESSVHEAGGDETCPLCGGSGEIEK